jgi:hypothetical protein
LPWRPERRNEGDRAYFVLFPQAENFLFCSRALDEIHAAIQAFFAVA